MVGLAPLFQLILMMVLPKIVDIFIALFKMILCVSIYLKADDFARYSNSFFYQYLIKIITTKRILSHLTYTPRMTFTLTQNSLDLEVLFKCSIRCADVS